MVRIVTVAAILGVAAARGGAAQDAGSLSGVVTERETGRRLGGAVVRVTPGDRSVMTSADGRYRIGALAAGRYEVSITLLGFEGAAAAIVIESGAARSDFVLVPEAVALAPLVVTGERITRDLQDAHRKARRRSGRAQWTASLQSLRLARAQLHADAWHAAVPRSWDAKAASTEGPPPRQELDRRHGCNVSRLAGLFLPVTTPFDAVTGDIAPIGLRMNLRKWLDHAIDGVVLFGSTGEGALLDEAEKVRLIGHAREVVPADVSLVAGTSGESTRAVVRQTRSMAAAGADALLVHPPAYFGPYLPAAAMVDYFRDVADASPIPVLVYHIPKFTKVTLEPGLVAELMRHPNIAGLKDSSGDVKRFASYTEACPDETRLFIGSGALFYTALELGAAGGILAAAVFAPAIAAAVLEAFRAGEATRAGQIQEMLTTLHREVAAAYGAVGVKAALDRIGYTGGPPRPPLRALGAKEQRRLAQVMQDAGLVSER